MSRLESQQFKGNVNGQKKAVKSEKSNAVLTENFTVRFSKQIKREVENLVGKNKPFLTQSALIRHCVRKQLPKVKG